MATPTPASSLGEISFKNSGPASVADVEGLRVTISAVSAARSFPGDFLSFYPTLVFGLAFHFLLGSPAFGQSKLGEKQPPAPGKTVSATNSAKLVALADDLRAFANETRGMSKALKDYQKEELEAVLAKRRNLVLADLRKVVKAGMESADPSDQGLAFLITGKFAEAEAKFVTASGKKGISTDNAALAHWRAGAACTYRGDERAALPHFQQALTLTPKAGSPQEWAALQYDIGKTSEELANLQPQEGVRLMEEAVKAFRASLELRTRATLPKDWADTQHELGNALSGLAERSVSSVAVKLLKEAVNAYREALQVRTRETQPLEWAKSNSNMANALGELCRRAEKTGEVESLMNEAGEAYTLATEVFTFEEYPQEWGAILSNQGILLIDLVPLTEGKDNQRTVISTAVECLQEALQVFTREAQPKRWAILQLNLGNALSTQARLGEKVEATPLLTEAEQAFRSAIEVCTREAQPLEWAAAQYNLGNVFRDLGDMETGEPQQEKWLAAEAAYKLALDVYTPESHPGKYQQMKKGLESLQQRLQKSTKELN